MQAPLLVQLLRTVRAVVAVDRVAPAQKPPPQLPHRPRLRHLYEVRVDCNHRVDPGGRTRVRDHPDVFAVGDTAAIVAHRRNLIGIRSGEEGPLPGVAQVAIQGGRYVASVIRRRVQGVPPPAPFCYWDKGELAIVGRTYAVADLKLVRFSGLFAWLLWAGVHIFFLIGFANRLLVMLQWGISFLTKRRGVRILSDLNQELTQPRGESGSARTTTERGCTT